MSSPKRGSIMKSVRKKILSDSVQVTVSADEALSMMVDADLSTHQYKIIRQRINKLVKNLLPSYDRIKEAKKKCYPSNKTVTELTATCDLQSLVDHSIERLCLSQKEVLGSMEDLHSGVKELSLLIKWGCDGAQQKSYKQKICSENKFDENLFSISMVPIQLRLNVEENNIIVWQNPAPSSTRYCRPIRFNFAKETTSLIKEEVDMIQQQIELLSPVEVSLDNFNILVKPVFMLTMIDGKICSALSDVSSSSQTCYICGAKPSEMNNPSLILMKPLDQTA
ncbi:hypothetical protein HF086_008894 [Spodoptera exigua]|uniref:V(D)J recombination-activating protein 1 RNase H domain-containing protein n=1 Tax=Spodoptera exigua TaxID=7107 RepID=A0A922M883_SPOEX|nr:hypothetical protein HF086_008894 [Spodoptera exigua]